MSIKPISETLHKLRGGLFMSECSDLFAAIVKGVEDTGKPGKLTLTLDVKKVGPAISVLAKATDKVPEQVPDADLFWATVEGNLTEQNPNQQSLELRAVEPRAPVRNVDPDTGEIRSVVTG